MSVDLLEPGALSNLAYEYVRHFGESHLFFEKHSIWHCGKRMTTEDELREHVFQILLKANVQSIRARYTGSPTWLTDAAKNWKFQPPASGYAELPLDAHHLVTLCDCFAYQAEQRFNDNPGSYRKTEAAKIIVKLRTAALQRLRGPFNVEHYGPPLKGYVL